MIVAKAQVCMITKREAVALDNKMSKVITMDPSQKFPKDTTGGALPVTRRG